MAVLSDPDRAAVNASLMRDLSQAREGCSLTKTQLQAAVNAADDWANTNASAFNSALPAAAQAGLTAAQKSRLLSYVVLKRWGG